MNYWLVKMVKNCRLGAFPFRAINQRVTCQDAKMLKVMKNRNTDGSFHRYTFGIQASMSGGNDFGDGMILCLMHMFHSDIHNVLQVNFWSTWQILPVSDRLDHSGGPLRHRICILRRKLRHLGFWIMRIHAFLAELWFPMQVEGKNSNLKTPLSKHGFTYSPHCDW